MVGSEYESLVRQLLQIIFTAMATNGLISAEYVQTFTGAGVALAVTIWGFWRARQQKKVLAATQTAVTAAVQIAAEEKVKSTKNKVSSLPAAERMVESQVSEAVGPDAVLVKLKNGHSATR